MDMAINLSASDPVRLAYRARGLRVFAVQFDASPLKAGA
jgi:hypothetical protein